MIYFVKKLFIVNYLLLSSIFAFGTGNPFQPPAATSLGNIDPFQFNPQESRYSETSPLNGDSNMEDDIFALLAVSQPPSTQAPFYSPEMPSAPIPLNMTFEEFLLQQTQTVDRSSPAPAAGDKRSSSMAESAQPSAKQTKYSNNFDILKVCYWQIAPNQPGYFQLCDTKDNVLYTGRVRTKYGLRKLNSGHLHIKGNTFKRHLNDTANLIENDFMLAPNEQIRLYSPMYDNLLKRKTYFKNAQYWRVHPNQLGKLQIFDKEGQILHEENVETRKGRRKLSNGYLKINGKQIRRHPHDKANLEVNGFAAGQSPRVITTDEAAIIDGNVAAAFNEKNGGTQPNSTDVSAFAYWQISPYQPGYFQLCDAKGNVLHTDLVITKQGLRKLNKGYLKYKGRALRHNPNDKANLEENGFEQGSNKKAKPYNSIPGKKASYFNKAQCWRIHPSKPNWVQVFDKEGQILHEESVETRKGRRKLSNGYLKISGKCIRRHPGDKENLEANSFAEGQEPRTLKREEAPIIDEIAAAVFEITARAAEMNSDGLDTILAKTTVEQTFESPNMSDTDTLSPAYTSPDSFLTSLDVEMSELNDNDLEWLLNPGPGAPAPHSPDIEMHDIQEFDFNFPEVFA